MTAAGEPGESPIGFTESVRRLGDSLLDLLRTRTELFSIELQEEKVRALKVILWIAAAIAVGMSGLLIAMGAVALLVWETAGYWGLIGLSAVALGVAALILWRVQQKMENGPSPFASTIAEFRKDAACLRQTE
jgi:uncharacterized membrane protein YqjE